MAGLGNHFLFVFCLFKVRIIRIIKLNRVKMAVVGGVLRNKGFSGVALMMMFYLICVVVRLGFAWLVWKFGERVEMLWVVLAVALAAVVGNIRGIMRNKTVWWFREFHLLVALALVVTCGLSLYYGGADRLVFKNVLVGLLVVDVGVGVLTSFVRKPFL